MSAFNPPNPYFNTIDYNKNFFSIQGNFVTLAYATKTFLNKITGGIISGLVSIIYSSSTPQLLIQNTNASGTSSVIFNNSTSSRSLNAGVGNSGNANVNYQNNTFVEAGTSANLILNAGGYKTNSQLMLLSNGNVGVGVNNPTNILQVGDAGRLRIGSGTTDFSVIGTLDTDTATTNTKIVISGNTRLGGNSGNIEYVSTSTGSHLFDNGTTELMRITNTGNVGIGVGTNPPLAKLDVRGQLNSEILYIVDSTSYGGNQNQLMINPHTASSSASLQTVRQGIGFNQNLTLQALGGNLGIGTTDPKTKFHLNGGVIYTQRSTADVPSIGDYGGNGDRLILSKGTATEYPYSIGISDATIWYSVNTGAKHNFYVGGSSIIEITSTNLNVNGVIKASSGSGNGSITINGGSSTKPGFIGFFNPAQQRVGYIGWTDTVNYLTLIAENTYLGYRVMGNFIIDNSLIFNSGINNRKIQLNGDGAGYSIGINTNMMRYEVPADASYQWFINNSIAGFLTSSGLTISGITTTGSLSSTGTMSSGQFYTRVENNIVMSAISIVPYSTTGGTFNNGYWLIDVQDYNTISGIGYLFLNIRSPSANFYWTGRVVIFSATSVAFYPDASNNVGLSLVTSFPRLSLMVACPTGTAGFSTLLHYKIMG